MKMNLQPLLAATLLLALAGSISGQSTERINVTPSGAEVSGWTWAPEISADGRFVAYESWADTLVVGDTNLFGDIFVFDRSTGQTERVSLSTLGTQGNDSSHWPSLSADGRYVAFMSFATNLVPGDTNATYDIFVHDRQTAITERVSISSSGVQGLRWHDHPSISADGRFVAFQAQSSNLVAGDTNGKLDIFVHDRKTGHTELVSVGSNGAQGNDDSRYATISADGRMVGFESFATNFYAGDSNSEADPFVHDRLTGVTELLNQSSSGTPGNRGGGLTAISANGRFAAFASSASNLVTGSSNNITRIFIRDLRAGSTEMMDISSTGGQPDGPSILPSISSDGRYVSFESLATNLSPLDTNNTSDVYIHDRDSGITEYVSVGYTGIGGDSLSRLGVISGNAQSVVFASTATNLVPGDTNAEADIFVRDRNFGATDNTIILTGDFASRVGTPLVLQWFAAPANASYRLAYSTNLNGFTFATHDFEIGTPLIILATGTTSAAGTGIFTSAPTPPSLAGATLYFEVGVQGAANVIYDSIVQAVTFF